MKCLLTLGRPLLEHGIVPRPDRVLRGRFARCRRACRGRSLSASQDRSQRREGSGVFTLAANTRNYIITDNFMSDDHFPLVLDCLRLCATLCLLADDPSVIEPDVLSKDQARFQQTGDPKYIDRACRRGKVGWNVGHRMEVMPHYRRPHMALVWTGAGRAVPKVVPRRGSVVHREKIEKVPSGFGGR